MRPRLRRRLLYPLNYGGACVPLWAPKFKVRKDYGSREGRFVVTAVTDGSAMRGRASALGLRRSQASDATFRIRHAASQAPSQA